MSASYIPRGSGITVSSDRRTSGFVIFSNVGKVHNKRPARAEKAAVQFLFKLTERLFYHIFLPGVDRNVVLPHLKIADFAKRKPYGLPVCIKKQRAFAPYKLLYGAVEHCHQLFLRNGFHQIMQCFHIVPVREVVRIPRNKNNLKLLVFPAHGFCKLHTARLPHFHVKKQDVPKFIFRISKQKCLRGRKGFQFNRDI